MVKHTIPEEKIAEIKQRNDIVEIIGEYLPLKPAGKNLKALCPFHSEKTPSFTVNPERQSYHCFGCGEGGNVFSFLMKREGFSFIEALRHLAQRAGVALPKRGESSEDAFSGKLILYEVAQAAAEFYHNHLIKTPQGEIARNYLIKRNISGETIKKFQLGYAPNSWDAFLAYGSRKGFTPAQMEAVGLIVPRRETAPGRPGGYYDRFRHRLIFPIVDISGRVVGFGGRSLGDEEPKYLNSPETALYSKGTTLFGLNLAKDAVRKEGFCYLVEGYFDLLRLYQEGFTNVAAVCGTALTPMQAKTLKRFAPGVTVIFDADPAGLAAAMRGIEILVEEEVNAQAVVLAAGKDPDDYMVEFGKEAFLGEVKKARNVVEYALEQFVTRYDLKTPEGKAAISREVYPLLRKVKNEIERSEYLRYLSDRVDKAGIFPLRTFYDELSRGIKAAPGAPQPAGSRPLHPTDVMPKGPEESLIILALADKEYAPKVTAALEEAEISDPVHKRIFLMIKNAVGQGKKDPAGDLLSSTDDEVRKKVSLLLSKEKEINNPEKIFQDCLIKIKIPALRRRMKELDSKIKEAEKAGDLPRLSQLLAEYNQLGRQVQEKAAYSV